MSEQTERNKEMIKKGYDAFTSGDIETVMSLFDDNIEWIQPGNSAISGTYHGKGELGEYFSRLAEKSPTVKLNVLLAEGDTVVALTQVAVGDETGQNADVFTLREGKTVRAQLFGDTAMMERVYGKKEVATG